MANTIEISRDGDRIVIMPWANLNTAKYLAPKLGRINGANFVRVLDGNLEVWEKRLDTETPAGVRRAIQHKGKPNREEN